MTIAGEINTEVSIDTFVSKCGRAHRCPHDIYSVRAEVSEHCLLILVGHFSMPARHINRCQTKKSGERHDFAIK
jgi:hypothetical protein